MTEEQLTALDTAVLTDPRLTFFANRVVLQTAKFAQLRDMTDEQKLAYIDEVEEIKNRPKPEPKPITATTFSWLKKLIK